MNVCVSHHVDFVEHPFDKQREREREKDEKSRRTLCCCMQQTQSVACAFGCCVRKKIDTSSSFYLKKCYLLLGCNPSCKLRQAINFIFSSFSLALFSFTTPSSCCCPQRVRLLNRAAHLKETVFKFKRALKISRLAEESVICEKGERYFLFFSLLR